MIGESETYEKQTAVHVVREWCLLLFDTPDLSLKTEYCTTHNIDASLRAAPLPKANTQHLLLSAGITHEYV